MYDSILLKYFLRTIFYKRKTVKRDSNRFMHNKCFFLFFPIGILTSFWQLKELSAYNRKSHSYLVTVDYGETFDLFGYSDLPLKKHSVMIKTTKHLELPR